MGLDERYERRVDHLLATAWRLSRTDADAVRANGAAEGSLNSGATIKRIIAALDARMLAAVVEALESLDRQVMRGEQRAHLRDVLKSKLRSMLRSEKVRRIAVAGLRDPGEAALKDTSELYEEVERRLIAEIDQHSTGFAKSDPISWASSHQTLTFFITTSISVIALLLSLAAIFLKVT